MTTKPEAYFGLPQDVVFCRRCVMSNQRPSSYPEFKHTPRRQTPTLHIDEDGVCDACRYAAEKPAIDWETREKELLALLDRHRGPTVNTTVSFPAAGARTAVLPPTCSSTNTGCIP